MPSWVKGGCMSVAKHKIASRFAQRKLILLRRLQRWGNRQQGKRLKSSSVLMLQRSDALQIQKSAFLKRLISLQKDRLFR